MLLAAIVAGLLILQISLSGSTKTAGDERTLVEQAGTIGSESPDSQASVIGLGDSGASASGGIEDISDLAADPGSAFYIGFTGSADPAGSSSGPTSQTEQPSAAGSLSGMVVDARDPGKSAIPRISVYLSRADGVFTGVTTMTGNDGNFIFEGLAPGAYKIYFFDLAGSWKAAWYGAATAPAGTPISVVSGGDANIVQGLERAAPEDGSIAGTVTDATGNGLAGVEVLAYFVDEANGILLILKGSAVTDADGNYVVTGLPASDSGTTGGNASHAIGYKVRYEPSKGNYASQWYDGQQTHETAKLMQVRPGETLAGIDAILTGGGTISGRITLEGGQSASSTLVDIFDETGVIVDTQIAAGDGSYQSDDLAAGIYHLRAIPRSSEYSMEWYENGQDLITSTAITVLVGQNTGGIDVVLERVKKVSVVKGEGVIGEQVTLEPQESGMAGNGISVTTDIIDEKETELAADTATAITEDEDEGEVQEEDGKAAASSDSEESGQGQPGSSFMKLRKTGVAADQ